MNCMLCSDNNILPHLNSLPSVDLKNDAYICKTCHHLNVNYCVICGNLLDSEECTRDGIVVHNLCYDGIKTKNICKKLGIRKIKLLQLIYKQLNKIQNDIIKNNACISELYNCNNMFNYLKPIVLIEHGDLDSGMVLHFDKFYYFCHKFKIIDDFDIDIDDSLSTKNLQILKTLVCQSYFFNILSLVECKSMDDVLTYILPLVVKSNKWYSSENYDEYLSDTSNEYEENYDDNSIDVDIESVDSIS